MKSLKCKFFLSCTLWVGFLEPAWGAGWSSQTSGTSQGLEGVHFPVNSVTGWVVGWNGTILKTTNGGTNWNSQTSGTSNALQSVNFPVDATTGYVSGDVGAILKTTNGGTNWNSQTSGVSVRLRSICFPVDVNTGYCVGDGGNILKTTNGGTNWNTQTSGTTQNLYNVHFIDNSTGYTVGDWGTILKTTNGGTNWTSQTSGTTSVLRGVHFPTSATTGYVVGGNGTILKTTNGGTNWTDITTPMSSYSGDTLRSVHFPLDATIGYAVGKPGTIYKTTNGGTTWNLQASPATVELLGVYFPVENDTGYTVGLSGTILKTDDGGGSQIILHPTGNGSVNSFTTATGCPSGHWDCVNDQSQNRGTGPPVTHDGTTSYLQDANGSTNREMFLLSNGVVPSGSTIFAIAVRGWVGEGSGGTKVVALSYQRMGTDGSPVDGSNITVSGSGCCPVRIRTNWTGLSWTSTHLDSLQIGIKHVSGGQVNLSQIYVVVSCTAPLSLSNTTRNISNGNITINWQGVQDNLYDVYYAESIASDFSDIADVTAGGTSVSWTDNGSQTPSHPDSVVQRYYRIKQRGGKTSTNTVGKYKVTTLDSAMSIVSIPFVPYTTDLDTVIGTQLTGGSSELSADRIWKWNLSLGKYKIAWLVSGGPNDGKWWDSELNQETDMTLGADEGFWIQNRHGVQNVTFVGKVSDTANRTISLVKGMQQIGSAYPVIVTLVNSELDQDGAKGAVNELDADRVWEWDPVTETYKFAWLIEGAVPDSGKWWDSSTGSETTVKLEPGVGLWFELRDLPGHANFTWTYPKPYYQPPN